MHTEDVRSASCDIYFFFPFISTFLFYFSHENVAADVLLLGDSLFYRPSSICVPGRTEEAYLLVYAKKKSDRKKVTDK